MHTYEWKVVGKCSLSDDKKALIETSLNNRHQVTSALKACLRRNTTADDTGLLGNNMDDGNSKKILSVSLIMQSFERQLPSQTPPSVKSPSIWVSDKSLRRRGFNTLECANKIEWKTNS